MCIHDSVRREYCDTKKVRGAKKYGGPWNNVYRTIHYGFITPCYFPRRLIFILFPILLRNAFTAIGRFFLAPLHVIIAIRQIDIIKWTGLIKVGRKNARLSGDDRRLSWSREHGRKLVTGEPGANIF